MSARIFLERAKSSDGSELCRHNSVSERIVGFGIPATEQQRAIYGALELHSLVVVGADEESVE